MRSDALNFKQYLVVMLVCCLGMRSAPRGLRSFLNNERCTGLASGGATRGGGERMKACRNRTAN